MRPYGTSSTPRLKFSHIYVEERALVYPMTTDLIGKFPGATVVPLSRYKHLFARPRQNYDAQKRHMKLILAVKSPPFLYPVPTSCQTFGVSHSVYTTPLYGCPFNCDFCFLLGMLDSANIVVFVNTQDFFREVRNAVKDRSAAAPLQVNLSYDTDLLAFEKLFGLCREWIEHAGEIQHLIVEIRTRSAAFREIADMSPRPNVKLAWSLSPDPLIRRYEHGAPSLGKRLASMAHAAERGWPLRVCFDPILPVDGWEALYDELAQTVFDALPRGALEDVALGTFRVGDTYLKRMKARRPRCDLFYGHAAIPHDQVVSFVKKHIAPRVGREKVDIIAVAP